MSLDFSHVHQTTLGTPSRTAKLGHEAAKLSSSQYPGRATMHCNDLLSEISYKFSGVNYAFKMEMISTSITSLVGWPSQPRLRVFSSPRRLLNLAL